MVVNAVFVIGRLFLHFFSDWSILLSLCFFVGLCYAAFYLLRFFSFHNVWVIRILVLSASPAYMFCYVYYFLSYVSSLCDPSLKCSVLFLDASSVGPSVRHAFFLDMEIKQKLNKKFNKSMKMSKDASIGCRSHLFLCISCSVIFAFHIVIMFCYLRCLLYVIQY